MIKILFVIFLFQLSNSVIGQTHENYKLIVDGIAYEYENPSSTQIKEWATKYKDICLRNIKHGQFDIPNFMEEENPCLVYLILNSRSIDSKEKQSWFDLYSLMRQEQIDKLYSILYREKYKLALIKERGEALNHGIQFYNGDSVTQDYAQAFSWFKKAADMGSGPGFNNLGEMYYEGKYVSKDYSKAYELFQKAVEKGSVYAIGNLGIMFYYGHYVKKDPQKAFELLKKSCDSDNPPSNAMRVLSACYRYGVGTAIDNEKSEYWLKKSAENGDKQAIKVLENENTK